jgi:ABC-type amino acid transport substrate-binding protein
MRGNRFWPALTCAAVLAAGSIAAACGDDDEGGATTGAATTGETTTAALETIESGKLIVGSDIPYAPFEFGRKPDYKGVDIGLVNEIGKRLGLEVEFKDTSFDTIFRDLAQGKFDMVATASTISAEREKEVDFSVPYDFADQSLMVKKGSDVKTVDDLKGRVVGAQKGTTGADYANGKTEAADVRTYGEIDDAFNALQAGQIEAVINDCPISKYAERAKPQLEVIQRLPSGEKYGLSFANGSDALREAVNEVLQEILDDGTYDSIRSQWLPEDPCKSLASA